LNTDKLINQPDPQLIQSVSRDFAWHYRVVPFFCDNDRLGLLISEAKHSPSVQNEMEVILNRKIELIPEKDGILENLLNRYYRKSNEQKFDAHVVRDHPHFINDLIHEALSLKSSDIHLEINEKDALVRMRIDGRLLDRFRVHRADYPAIINKIKIRSNLDISEKRLPQDGRIQFSENDISLDLRVSIIPTRNGEKVVMRLLSKDAGKLKLENVGFSEKQLKSYREIIRSQNGIILISGPTGSGKTTTLYATLSELNTGDTNILTIEDPIEYTINRINQVQVKESIGLDFSKALRSFLRQDPDIIMIGEIRDKETANMAIRAALTGHLVFSTIHTNSAWATVSRLIDMGIPPFLVSATLRLSMAQRLVRKLCTHCKAEAYVDELSIEKRLAGQLSGITLYQASGCEKCYHSGYAGRAALHEMIPINEELRQTIGKHETRESYIQDTFHIESLADQAIKLVQRGITSLEEIYPILLDRS
jgi:general secretion pathway protein E/type IV pilus assembly protein PilB